MAVSLHENAIQDLRNRKKSLQMTSLDRKPRLLNRFGISNTLFPAKSVPLNPMLISCFGYLELGMFLFEKFQVQNDTVSMPMGYWSQSGETSLTGGSNVGDNVMLVIL